MRQPVKPFFNGSQKEAPFVSKSISTNGRNQASVKTVMFPNEFAVESREEFRLEAPRLQQVSPASRTQSCRSTGLCLVWNF